MLVMYCSHDDLHLRTMSAVPKVGNETVVDVLARVPDSDDYM